MQYTLVPPPQFDLLPVPKKMLPRWTTESVSPSTTMPPGPPVIPPIFAVGAVALLAGGGAQRQTRPEAADTPRNNWSAFWPLSKNAVMFSLVPVRGLPVGALHFALLIICMVVITPVVPLK